MRCTQGGCPGSYEQRLVTHTVRHHGDIKVLDHVPAEVCSICGDVLFAPETVARIEEILRADGRPAGRVPVYEYAAHH